MNITVALCKSCYRNDSISGHLEERCNEGDTVANLKDCRSYTICIGRRWKSRQCKVGTFWNQQLKRCHHVASCEAFKRVECNHGQVTENSTLLNVLKKFSFLTFYLESENFRLAKC